jgi:hypothetical protein
VTHLGGRVFDRGDPVVHVELDGFATEADLEGGTFCCGCM